MLGASATSPVHVDDASSVGIAVTSSSDEALGLSEWPPLPHTADVGMIDDRSTDWLDYSHPPELSDIPVGTPEDVIWVVKESLVKDRYRAPSISSERKSPSWRSSFAPDSSPPIPLEPQGSNSSTRRHYSVSTSSQISSTTTQSEGSNGSTKSIPGYTVKMGPLGWIIVPDKSEDAPKKSKSMRESGLKKFLKDRSRSVECASCLNSLSARYMVPLRCQHKYCQPCFAKLVSISMKHENIFPPKCCLEEIPIKTILSNLSRAQIDEYRLKEEEYATPLSARWYCASNSCSKWIPSTKLTRSCDTQRCPHCHVIICATCRSLTHRKKEGCPQDFGPRAAREEEANSTTRCFRCQSTVELKASYRITTCACSAQICCICGTSLQACSCTEIDVARWQEGIRTRRRGLSQGTNQPPERFSTHTASRSSGRASEYSQDLKWNTVEDRKTAHVSGEKRILEITRNIHFLKFTLSQINKSQQTALNSRHRTEGQDLETRTSSNQDVFDREYKKLAATLEVNLKTRKEAMAAEHASEFDKLKATHEEEEDETFMNLCRYLKNKPNREAREAGIIEKLRVTHEEELVALKGKQKAALEDLESNGNLELKGLTSGIDYQMQEKQRKEKDAITEYSRMVNVERRWFEEAVRKRSQILEQYRTNLLDGEPGVSGPSVAPPRESAVELPANEPVILAGGGHNWEGSELEGDIPLTSKLGTMAL